MSSHDHITAEFAVGLKNHTWFLATKEFDVVEEWFRDDLIELSGIRDVLRHRDEVAFITVYSFQYIEVEMPEPNSFEEFLTDYLTNKED